MHRKHAGKPMITTRGFILSEEVVSLSLAKNQNQNTNPDLFHVEDVRFYTAVCVPDLD